MTASKKYLSLLNQAYNEIELPASIREEIGGRLQKEQKRFRLKKQKQKIGMAFLTVSSLFGLFLAGIVFNSDIRAFASEIPLLEKLVPILTGETYQKENPQSEINIKVPKIDSKSDITTRLNAAYLAEGQQAYQQALEQLKQFENKNISVSGTFEKIVDDERFLVLNRKMTTIAADNSEKNHYDTVDKKNNVVLSLPLLFKNASYLPVLTDEIKEQMRKRIAEDSSIVYWAINGAMKEELSLTAKQNFYINKEHQLVISFDQFEVAPGYMGKQEFIIPTEKLKDVLVDKSYLAE